MDKVPTRDSNAEDHFVTAADSEAAPSQPTSTQPIAPATPAQSMVANYRPSEGEAVAFLGATDNPFTPDVAPGPADVAEEDEPKYSVRQKTKSFFRPSYTVMFPKFVVVNNPRIAIMYYILMSVVVLYSFVSTFIINQEYLRRKFPTGEVALTHLSRMRGKEDVMASMNRDQNDEKDHCVNSGKYSFTDALHDYQPSGCLQLCSTNTSGLCTSMAEVDQKDIASVFYPTFIRQTIIHSPLAAEVACNPPYKRHEQGDYDGMCVSREEGFVPGVEDNAFSFAVRFRVKLPESMIYGTLPDEVGDSRAKTEDAFKIAVIDWRGDLYKTFDAGEVLELSVRDLLAILMLDEFQDQVSRPELDIPYTHPDLGISYNTEAGKTSNGPTIRLTGLDVSLKVEFTNKDSCQFNAKTKPTKVCTGGCRLACVSAKGIRKWVTKTKTSTVDAHTGTTIEREYHGIRVTFTTGGYFTFIDLLDLFCALTTVLVWAQIPQFVLQYFVVTFLGRMSKMYNRVINQDSSIKACVNNLATRLIGNSSAFLDVADKRGGVTFERFTRRLVQAIKTDHVDQGTLAGFISFVHSELKGDGNLAHVSHWCDACSSTSTIKLDSLCKIFDVDRQLGPMERVFNDKVVSEVFKVAQVTKGQGEAEAAAEGEEAANVMMFVKAKNDKPLENQEKKKKDDAVEEGMGTSMSLSGMDKQLSYKPFMSNRISVQQSHQASASAGKKLFYQSNIPCSVAHVKVIGPKIERLKARVENYMGPLQGDMDPEKPRDSVRKVVQLNSPLHLGPGPIADPEMYEGQWANEEYATKREGQGKQNYHNGSSYEGQWKNDLAHGHGVFKTVEGSSYEGGWREGVKDGRGVENLSSGSRYEGEYKNGGRHGNGALVLPDLSRYEGCFENNFMHGEGILTWPHENYSKSYEGQWKMNVMSGHGTYKWPDKSMFIGSFENDMKHGQGVFEWPDGRRYEGQYEENSRHGYGVFQWTDGRKYEGQWMHGRQNGEGKLLRADGSVQSGLWQDGVVIKEH